MFVPSLLLVSMPLSSYFFYVGSALILHSAYSLLHYRELLQELQDSAVATSSIGAASPSAAGGSSSSLLAQPPDLPSDVIIEVVAGFVFLLISEMVRPGSALRPIASTAGQRRHQVVAPVYVSRDWDIYSTRAKAF
jgi:hypothetical protein